MANKIYNYEIPAEYSYDTNKILVDGGIVSLKEDLINVYARYHLNEATGATVLDTSGNGRNGTPVNNPTSVVGKLNNCLSFNGINQYVNCGNIADFERTDSFSFECWFKTSVTSGTRCLFGKYIPTKGFTFYIISSQINFWMANSAGNQLAVRISDVVTDGAWYHCIVTYDGSSSPSGIHIYLNNVDKTITVLANSLTLSIVHSGALQIGNGGNNEFPFSGLIDEAVIYNKVLTQEEVTYRYNSGVGRENFGYPTDKPTINPTTSWLIPGISEFFGFNEILGVGNQGNIGYQLSDDDGISWRYWNGSAWVVTSGVTNYNSAVVVGANIDNFPITNEKIMYRAILISDSNQQCELDTNEITATVGYPPNVYAGVDKTCKDHETKKPFSDAVISDPDGDIENATAYRKIESGIYTQILKGGYGTLQDAIRNFEYTFDNLGAIDCILKITDEEGFSNEDTMVMTVSKYQVIFNIKDTDGNHLGNILCDFDDGAGWQIKNSPFTYQFEYKVGNYRCTFDKTGFISQSVEVPISEHTENITLQRLTVDPSAIADAVWDELKSGHLLTNSFGKETQDIKLDTTSIISTLSTLVATIWNYSTRTLTSFGTLIVDIWSYSTRTLTSYGTLINDIAIAVWGATTRTLTSFGTLVNSIWTNLTRTLTAGTKDSEIDAIKIQTDKIPDLDTKIKRTLGLQSENYRITSFTYDGELLIAATIKIYPTKADVLTDTNALAIYKMEATYDIDGKSTGYRVTKES